VTDSTSNHDPAPGTATRDGRCAVTLAGDGMEALLELLPPAAGGRPLEVADVLAALAAHAVSHGILHDDIAAAVARAQSGDGPVRLVAARGTPAQAGRDARLVLSHKERVGLEMANGRIDYNEHDYPWNVQAGETIGFLLAHKPHSDGSTVTGTVIRGQPAHPIALELAGIRRDERGKLVAEADGVLVASSARLAVANLLVVNGDLDNTVGNVHSKSGVHVRGHVAPGLVLGSQRDVIVDQNVEDATIKASGSITIKGGIRGRHSEIFTPGNLTTSFIENAAVFANGDINVTRSIINSTVACNGAIFAGSPTARHAAVMGGELTAHRLIEVVELGSPAYARTLVRLGVPQEQRRQLNQLLADLDARDRELLALDQLEARYRTRRDAPDLLGRIALERAALTEQRAAQQAALAALRNQLGATGHGHLVVHKRVFPGVIVSINDATFTVTAEYGRGRFSFADEAVRFHPG
jgi:uncharacterized protein (DUF342 family)